MAKIPFPLESPDDATHLSAIIYGDTGTGKTHLLGTAADCPEVSPALFIDTDIGTSTIRGKKIYVTRPNSWDDVQEIFDWLRHKNDKFKSVLIDGLTETQAEQSLGTILGEVNDGYYKDLGKTIVADRQEWLKTGNQMRKFIRAFRSLARLEDPERRVHVFMTARERFDEKRKLTLPSLSGQLGAECGAFVDILARMSAHVIDGETRYHMLTEPHISDETGIKYLAKNRGGRLGRQIWSPTMSKIITKWTSVDADSDGGS